MNLNSFNDILFARLDKIKKTLFSKDKEYAQDDDRLYNFKVAARILNTNQEKALWGMAMKHLVTVQDMVEGKLTPSQEMIDEKIGDMINYLILLEAVFYENNSY